MKARSSSGRPCPFPEVRQWAVAQAKGAADPTAVYLHGLKDAEIRVYTIGMSAEVFRQELGEGMTRAEELFELNPGEVVHGFGVDDTIEQARWRCSSLSLLASKCLLKYFGRNSAKG